MDVQREAEPPTMPSYVREQLAKGYELRYCERCYCHTWHRPAPGPRRWRCNEHDPPRA